MESSVGKPVIGSNGYLNLVVLPNLFFSDVKDNRKPVISENIYAGLLTEVVIRLKRRRLLLIKGKQMKLGNVFCLTVPARSDLGVFRSKGGIGSCVYCIFPIILCCSNQFCCLALLSDCFFSLTNAVAMCVCMCMCACV